MYYFTKTDVKIIRLKLPSFLFALLAYCVRMYYGPGHNSQDTQNLHLIGIRGLIYAWLYHL